MEFFDGMAQKTKNISEIMKLTAAVSSEKERQEKIYRELLKWYLTDTQYIFFLKSYLIHYNRLYHLLKAIRIS